MYFIQSVVAVAFILFAATVGAEEPGKKAEEAKQELKKLQGTWRLDEKESLFFWTEWMNEERFPSFHEFSTGRAIQIREDKLRYGEKLEREIAIALGTADGKKTISFKHGDNTPVMGIYELEKGIFRVCVVDPNLGGGKEAVRLPEECRRTRAGWFAQFESTKP